VTLFPETFAAVTDSGVTRRALEQGLWRLALWNPRDFHDGQLPHDRRRPYGGGPVMVMLAEPLGEGDRRGESRGARRGESDPSLASRAGDGSRKVMSWRRVSGLFCCADATKAWTSV